MLIQNPTATTAPKGEIKAALLADFLGKPLNASQWIKAMKAYFSINPQIYHDDEIKTTIILSKLSIRKGIPFSEIWYDKMENAVIKQADKDLTHFIKDFEKNFSLSILE